MVLLGRKLSNNFPVFYYPIYQKYLYLLFLLYHYYTKLYKPNENIYVHTRYFIFDILNEFYLKTETYHHIESN